MQNLFDPAHSLLGMIINKENQPWRILDQLKDLILELGPTLKGYEQLAPDVWVAPSAQISEKATILGPTIIGEDTEVRPGAYLRGSVLVGSNVVVGNSTELKNCILYDGVQVPHFNYVGDSILGHKAHFGAGVIAANLRADGQDVVLKYDGAEYPTGRRKVGAFIGDHAEIGCNSVLNPGTIIGCHAKVYPLSSVRGTVLPGETYQTKGN